jgi:hypothetical protein
VVAAWGSIPYFPFLDRVAIAKEIEQAWPVLEPMRGENWGAETKMDWDAETKMASNAVELLSRTTKLLLPTPGAKRRQLSFLSKYLHWRVNGAFPIWDSQARAALNYDAEVSWESYRDWLICVRGAAATHKACLEQVRSSDECLLRTLDKALWELGRPKKE